MDSGCTKVRYIHRERLRLAAFRRCQYHTHAYRMLLKTDDDHTNAGASRAASEVLGNAQHRGTRVRAS